MGATLPHVNIEHRERCARAEMMQSIRHISNENVCEALINGHFAWTNLIAADVCLNRRLRGPCPQCLEGKFRREPMHPSDTPSATSVGMCVVIDTQTLCAKSPGGNLYYIDSIDEFSGDVQVTPAKS